MLDGGLTHPKTQTISGQMERCHLLSWNRNSFTVAQTRLEGRWNVRKGNTIKQCELHRISHGCVGASALRSCMVRFHLAQGITLL